MAFTRLSVRIRLLERTTCPVCILWTLEERTCLDEQTSSPIATTLDGSSLTKLP